MYTSRIQTNGQLLAVLLGLVLAVTGPAWSQSADMPLTRVDDFEQVVDITSDAAVTDLWGTTLFAYDYNWEYVFGDILAAQPGVDSFASYQGNSAEIQTQGIAECLISSFVAEATTDLNGSISDTSGEGHSTSVTLDALSLAKGDVEIGEGPNNAETGIMTIELDLDSTTEFAYYWATIDVEVRRYNAENDYTAVAWVHATCTGGAWSFEGFIPDVEDEYGGEYFEDNPEPQFSRTYFGSVAIEAGERYQVYSRIYIDIEADGAASTWGDDTLVAAFGLTSAATLACEAD